MTIYFWRVILVVSTDHRRCRWSRILKQRHSINADMHSIAKQKKHRACGSLKLAKLNGTVAISSASSPRRCERHLKWNYFKDTKRNTYVNSLQGMLEKIPIATQDANHYKTKCPDARHLQNVHGVKCTTLINVCIVFG